MFLTHLFIKKFNYAFCLLNFPCIPAILKINSILSDHFIHIKSILFVNRIRKTQRAVNLNYKLKTKCE